MEFQILQSAHNTELLQGLVSPQQSVSKVSVIDYDEQKNNVYYTNLLGSDVLYFINTPAYVTYTLPSNYFLSKLFTQLEPGASKLWYVYTNGSNITLSGPSNDIVLTSNLSIVVIQALTTTSFQLYNLTSGSGNGSEGYTGYTGATGINGSADIIGVTGSTGYTGIAGLANAPLGSTGSTGVIALIGFDGYTGTSSFGPTGSTGSASSTGPPGPIGPVLYGPTGIYGVSSNTGATGPAGFYTNFTQVFTNTPGPSPTFVSPGIPSTWTTSFTSYGGQLTILADLQANHTFSLSGGGKLPINFLIDGNIVGLTTFDWVTTIPYFSVVNAFIPVNNISAGSHSVSVSIPFIGAQVSTSNVLNMTIIENVPFPNSLPIGRIGPTGYTGFPGLNANTGATGPIYQITGAIGSIGISTVTGCTGFIGSTTISSAPTGSIIYSYNGTGTIGYTGTFLYLNSSLSVGSVNTSNSPMTISSSINPSLLKLFGTNSTTSDNASIYINTNFNSGSIQAGIFSKPTFSLSSTTVNTASNFYISMNYTGSSFATNSYGVYIDRGLNTNTYNPMTGYGLYIQNPTGTQNIYCASFSGPVGIGIQQPSYPVSVYGPVRALNLNSSVNSQILVQNNGSQTLIGIGASTGSFFPIINGRPNQKGGDMCISFNNTLRLSPPSIAQSAVRIFSSNLTVANADSNYPGIGGRKGLIFNKTIGGGQGIFVLKLYTIQTLNITMQLLNFPFTTTNITINIAKIGGLTSIIWPQFLFTTSSSSVIVSTTPIAVPFCPNGVGIASRTGSFIVPVTANGNNQFGRLVIDSSGYITIYYDLGTSPFPANTANCGLLPTTNYYMSYANPN